MSGLPVVTELPIDSRTGHFSMAWRQWLQTIDRALNQAGTDTTALSADIAAIATALGSPDGTVANIPDQDALDVVIYGRDGVTVTGKAGVTDVYVELQDGGVTNTKLADMAASTVKARKSAGDGSPEDCTVAEVLDLVAGTPTKGDLLVRDTSAYARIAAPAAGLVLTSNGAGTLPTYQASPSSRWTTVSAPSNVDRASTTTLADDSVLKFAIAASTNYHIRGKIYFKNNNAGSGGQVQLNHSGTFSVVYLHNERQVFGAASSTDNETTQTVEATSFGALPLTSAFTGIGFYTFDAIICSTTAGTLSVQWAQAVSSAANLTRLLGSYIEYMVV